MLRAVLISASLLAVPVTVAAPAAAAYAAEDPKRCDDSAAKKKKKSMFGGMMGGIAGNVLGRAGVPGSIGGVIPTSDLLSEVITALLDCKEQKQAADGSHCMTVTDVVIVDGEETTAPKRMCRAPGASGYRRV